jgi:Uma2 family endonuclease
MRPPCETPSQGCKWRLDLLMSFHAAPAKHRLSVKEYYRMAETGVLDPDARVELLDGEIIDLPPIGPFHGIVTKFLIELFTSAAKGRWIMAVQDPVRLDDHSEPQPDLMLLKPSANY